MCINTIEKFDILSHPFRLRCIKCHGHGEEGQRGKKRGEKIEAAEGRVKAIDLGLYHQCLCVYSANQARQYNFLRVILKAMNINAVAFDTVFVR